MITKFVIFEGSEFNQYNMGAETQNPFGAGYGFATDAGLSIYSDDNNRFQDFYARSAGTTNKLMQIAKDSGKKLFDDPRFNRKNDRFLQDSEFYKNLKILRMVENKSLKLDIFVSFEFNEQEILQDNGKISHEVAIDLAEKEFEKFTIQQDQNYISDFDREIKDILPTKK